MCFPNSLTADTNNQDPNRPLCFQNASYEHNTSSFSQSPVPPECPETNIYDLPFQTPAGLSKEAPKSQGATPKGSIRYTANRSEEALPKGSIRYTANRHKSVGESKSVYQDAPESPRVNEIEFSTSVNKVAVTEYEVPISQQEY